MPLPAERTMSSPWLTECERELIHQPGAIQSWGALLIADEAELIVRYASANLADYIQVSAADAIGKPVGAVLEPETAARLVAAAVSEPRPGSAVACAEPAGDRPALTLSSYRLNGSIYIELELPAEATHAVTWSDARAVIEAIRGARSLPSLMTIAAAELRRATGFDRSMVYRFDAIGHGEVVAENCAPDLESFLGLHYPASDVPRQARRLYLRQRVRAIEDALAAPVPLAGSAGGSATPDLSLSALRAVSPVHLQYLRNMAVRATIAVSLTVDGALWGMLVCHHRGPRRADPGTRALADLIGQVTSLMIGTLRDAEARTAEATAPGSGHNPR